MRVAGKAVRDCVQLALANRLKGRTSCKVALHSKRASRRDCRARKAPCYFALYVGTLCVGAPDQSSATERVVEHLWAEQRETADLLAHLAKVEERGLHLQLGFASLFAYCQERLRMSESAAWRRIAAARVCRQCPQVFSQVARGDLHLSALCALRPHLLPHNASELFAACLAKSRRQVDTLLAQRFPRPDIRDSIRKLPIRAKPERGVLVQAVALPVPATMMARHAASNTPTRNGGASRVCLVAVECARCACQASSPLTSRARQARVEPLSTDR